VSASRRASHLSAVASRFAFLAGAPRSWTSARRRTREKRDRACFGGLLGDTGTYFAALTAYRAGDPDPIVKIMAEATFPAIGNGRHLAAVLQAARDRWNNLITARRGAAAHRLADLLIQHPVIDMPLVARELSLATSNAQLAIDRLVVDGSAASDRHGGS
jgi:hypothetical protein